jgi:hypothetical protein
MKKDGEYQSLKENLDGVVKRQEEIKSNIEILSDSKRHLGMERRLSVFDVYTKMTSMYVDISNAGFDIDDGIEDSLKISKRQDEYIGANGKYLLLNDPPATSMDAQHKLDIAVLLYRKEIFDFVFDFARKRRRGERFDDEHDYGHPLNAIHKKHTETIDPMFSRWRDELKQQLKAVD